MTAHILDGKALAQSIRLRLKLKVERLREKGEAPPHLVVVLVGQNVPSQIYVGHKIKACEEVGVLSTLLSYNENISEAELLGQIKTLSEDPAVDGILVQLPLPFHINNKLILLAIDPLKDVDGFHPENIGLLAVNTPRLTPATPRGIMELLEHYVRKLEGLHAVIVGASNIVGRPTALSLLNRRCTVSICHSKTQNLMAMTKQADVLISATGNHGLITKDHVKPGAIVVDVGIHRLESGKVVGDVLFDEVAEHVAWITPVPGGVGPMTIAGLLENTFAARELCRS